MCFPGLQCHPRDPPNLYFPNTLQAIEIMQLLIMQVSAASCHLLCHRFKQIPVPSVLTWPPVYELLYHTVSDTLNSCHSYDVTEYNRSSKSILYSHPYVPGQETKMTIDSEIIGRKKVVTALKCKSDSIHSVNLIIT
jgi:hypothetical protein